MYRKTRYEAMLTYLCDFIYIYTPAGFSIHLSMLFFFLRYLGIWPKCSLVEIAIKSVRFSIFFTIEIYFKNLSNVLHYYNSDQTNILQSSVGIFNVPIHRFDIYCTINLQ